VLALSTGPPPGWLRSFFFVSSVEAPGIGIVRQKWREPVRLPAIPATLALFRCCEVDFVDELSEEDRLGDRTLSHFARSAGVDDGDVRNPDKSQHNAEVRPFGVVLGQRALSSRLLSDADARKWWIPGPLGIWNVFCGCALNELECALWWARSAC